MHKNELICQKCAINCGIEGNASNENITKYKNLSGVKSISNSVHRLARYRIVALISIGRLCMLKFPVNNYDLKESSLITFHQIFHSITHSHISFLLEDPLIDMTSKQHLSLHIIRTAQCRQKCSIANKRSGIHSTIHSTFQSAKRISS